MIRLLKEHYWQEAYAGVGSIEGHVIVGDKMYVPRVRERLQYVKPYAEQGNDLIPMRDMTTNGYWVDIPTVERRLPEPPCG